MFKSHELVIKLEKTPKRKRIDDVEMDVESPREAKPIDISKTVDSVMVAAMATIMVYFGCDTLRGVITHVVVTKVRPPIIIEAVKED